MTASPLFVQRNNSHTTSRVSRYARQHVYKATLHSRLTYEQDIPTFRRDELILGDLLGSGTFNHVYELKALHVTDCNARQDRARLAVVAAHHPQTYAVKFLKKEALSNPNAAADLLLEAKYLTALAGLEHPNIIRLHGISATVEFEEEGGFFLILDRLQETFRDRVAEWKLAEKNATDPSRLRELFVERLQAGVQLSCALEHLHQLGIIFRDLKSDNIGFDANQNLVLFDFGLAKELDPRERTSQGLYLMSGNTGARRFMAPEVALRLPYSLSADVYSFSMILWELCALEPVFDNMSMREHLEVVIQRNKRPRLSSDWSASLKDLLRCSWARDPSERPNMARIHKMLQHEVEEATPHEVSSDERYEL